VDNVSKPMSRINNRFVISEWSGAIGDLGLMLPLAFAMVIYNGYPPQRLFFLWGITYFVTGWYFRVPVAVQPLKAMAVIAIASGYSIPQLASSAFFYGVLLILLVSSGVIRWLEKWFSAALVRGIQLGIGLILLQKAISLILNNPFYLGSEIKSFWFNIIMMIVILAFLGVFQFWQKKPVAIIIISVSILISLFTGVESFQSMREGAVVQTALPDLGFLAPGFLFLIIPQLPLTLGNAVFAANETCSLFWKDRSQRVNPNRLALSMGISNILIGLFGGFPICHGAGGMAAHAKFGGKTGGTTMIIGAILILISLIKPLTEFLFLIPVPVFGAMLIITSWGLIILMKKLECKHEVIIAVLVGVISFATRNLFIALVAGFILEQVFISINKKVNEKNMGKI